MDNRHQSLVLLRRSVLVASLAAALGNSGAAGAGSAFHNNHGVAPSSRGIQNAWARGAGHTADWRQKIAQAKANKAALGSGPTVVVTSCADSGAGTLRQAAIDAVADTTIDMSALTCSTISLTSGAIAVTVDGVDLLGPGQDVLTIDGQGNDRVLTSTYSLGVKYLTIANGYANGPGGCIRATGFVGLDHSTVTGCQVVGNAGGTGPYVGGGVASLENLVMAYSTVSGNSVTTTGTADAHGGGVYAAGEAAVLYGSSVDNNSVETADGDAGGGGLFTKDDAVVYYDSRVSGNSVVSANGTAYGGGIELKYEAPPIAQGAVDVAPTGAGAAVAVGYGTISGNSTHSETKWTYGGGIHAYAGLIQLQHATVSGNTASSNCAGCINFGGGASAILGGIYSYYSTTSGNTLLAPNGDASGGGLAGLAGSSPVGLVNSTVSGNQVDAATASGGGVFLYDTPVYSYNSTVALNTASGKGGGLYTISSTATLVSSIFADNQAAAGADVAADAAVAAAGDHNLIESAGPNFTVPVGTLTGDPLLEPLRNNGGSTATHGLVACSPAIDAGSNPLLLSLDQRGTPFSRSWAASQDIGAFELQPNADIIFRDGFDPDPCI